MGENDDRHLRLDQLLEHIATRVRFSEPLDDACEGAIDDVNAGRVEPHPPLRLVAFFCDDDYRSRVA